MSNERIAEILDKNYRLYCNFEFFKDDPVAIPHLFSKKEDIEVSAFLSSILAFGKRSLIYKASYQLVKLMDFAPYSFILQATDNDIGRLKNFKYRTFQFDDLKFFLKVLKEIYTKHGSLQKLFEKGFSMYNNIWFTIEYVRSIFFPETYVSRSQKHFPSPAKNSACKRINLFLRWMVRKDDCGVDFGIWNEIPPAHLLCPLDVHSGRIARKLGLLQRTQNDRRATDELTQALKLFDPTDPVKYDYALFGLGLCEKIFRF